MPEISGLVLKVNFQKTDKVLTISYSMENHKDIPVYLTNHAVRMDPVKGQIPDKSVVFTYIDSEKKALHFTKRLPPVPQKLIQPPMHFVTPLPPGKTFRERIEIPLPLIPYAPYEGVPANAVAGKEIFHHAYFSIGLILGQPGLTTVESTCQGTAVHLLAPVLDDKGHPVGTFDTTEHYSYSRVMDMDISCCDAQHLAAPESASAAWSVEPCLPPSK